VVVPLLGVCVSLICLCFFRVCVFSVSVSLFVRGVAGF
jgi:hypothetical protein